MFNSDRIPWLDTIIIRDSNNCVRLETRFKAYIVWLMLNGETEKALEKLAEHYEVETPKLKVGLPKRYKTRTLGTYTTRHQTISVLNSDMLKQPLVIIHEFYHHLRIDLNRKHRGNERNAREFAQDYVEAYNKITNSVNH
jgi:hypothetical protein